MTDNSSTSADPVGSVDKAAVLFVDDEAEILSGLRTSLRKLRSTYNLHFANSGEEALEVLAKHRIDVVVSDMRMPGMNGVELLTEIRALHPNVIRCILSGEAEQELVMRAIPVTHRWLTKPCDRDELCSALAESVRHRDLLADPVLGVVLASADSLPSPPHLHQALLDSLADQNVSVDRIADLVGADPAISAKLMQWANSAFSAGSPVADLKTAIVRVGFSAVSQLVLLAEVMASFGDTDLIPGMNVDTFEVHCAMISELAGQLSPPETAAEARLGGLFSGLGLLLEAGYLPSRLNEAYDVAMEDDISLLQAERDLHGIGHPELGAHLLSIWGLPSDLVLLACGANDLPEPSSLTQNDGESLPPMEAVRFARLLAQRAPHAATIGSPHLDRLDDELLEAVSNYWVEIEAQGESVS